MSEKGDKKGDKYKGHYTPDQVVKEIVLSLSLSIADGGKVLEENALKEWRKDLFDTVEKQLKKREWELDQVAVLTVARVMGKIAVMLADENPRITRFQILAAFEAAKEHEVCNKARVEGLGCWCDCAR